MVQARLRSSLREQPSDTRKAVLTTALEAVHHMGMPNVFAIEVGKLRSQKKDDILQLRIRVPKSL